MPRLADVLEYLRQPGRERVWVLLDIKVSAPLDGAGNRAGVADEDSVPMTQPLLCGALPKQSHRFPFPSAVLNGIGALS